MNLATMSQPVFTGVVESLPSQFYVERQNKTESNARTYARRFQLAIRRAQGLYLTDTDGRVYMDCLCGAGTLALGHNHPVIVEALREHLTQGYPLHTLDITTPVKDAFVEELFSTLPASFAKSAKVHFCSPSGADAVEAALKLVKTATGRAGIVSFTGAYHGQTHGALALMGDNGPKVPGLMPGAVFQPYPNSYRCPMGNRECGACGGKCCSDFVEDQLTGSHCGVQKPAGMIMELVQGEGGVVPAPAEWVRAMRRFTAEQGIPLIFDEVQTGWGRTGKMYAFEHAGVTPDVLVLSKAIGGSLPLAVIVYRDELDVWKPGAHTGTFRGNQLAMAAGLATMRYFRENDLLENVERASARFFERVAPLRSRHAFVGDIRGRGLMIGIEIVNPLESDRRGRAVPDGKLAEKLQMECFSRGLIVERGGTDDSVFRLLPPLTITRDQVDTVCDIITEAFGQQQCSSN